jgi:excinuclease ABC subunit B
MKEPLLETFNKNQISELIDQLFIEMKKAAKELDFERAAELRDEITFLSEKIK